jgi:hypothetical protein
MDLKELLWGLNHSNIKLCSIKATLTLSSDWGIAFRAYECLQWFRVSLFKGEI